MPNLTRRCPIPPKGWRKNQLENLEKQAEEATGVVVVRTNKVEEHTPPAVQEVSAGEKKKLPRIIVASWDKRGNLVHQTFVCASISMQKDESTELGDGSPTKRKDRVHIVLEADVVGFE